MVNYKKVRDHIQEYWINEVKDIVEKHAYMSIGVIGIGIEFLGKCLDYYTPWHSKAGTSKWHFELAIRKLPSLQKKYLQFISYVPKINCDGINSKLVSAPQITGNATIKSHIDAAVAAIQSYNQSVTTTPSAPRTLSDVEVNDLIETQLGNVSQVYFDNSKNTNLGTAIAELQKAQQLLLSVGDLHPSSLDLYSALRCGMAHAGLPNQYLHFTSATDKAIYDQKDEDGRVTHWILDAKNLYKDFQDACVELMNYGDPEVQKNLDTTIMVVYN